MKRVELTTSAPRTVVRSLASGFRFTVWTSVFICDGSLYSLWCYRRTRCRCGWKILARMNEVTPDFKLLSSAVCSCRDDARMTVCQSVLLCIDRSCESNHHQQKNYAAKTALHFFFCVFSRATIPDNDKEQVLRNCVDR